MTARTDEELVAMARRGDFAALEALWLRHQPRLRRLVLSVTRNQEDAADALQETLLKVYRHLGSHRGEARFSSWAYRVALNAARDVLRRHGRQVRIARALAPHTAAERNVPPPHEVLEARERARALYAAMAGLRPWMRRVITLSDLKGWSCQRVSSTLGIPQGTVKSRLHRARRELADRLAPVLSRQD